VIGLASVWVVPGLSARIATQLRARTGVGDEPIEAAPVPTL
jgi:hypothetical protein